MPPSRGRPAAPRTAARSPKSSPAPTAPRLATVDGRPVTIIHLAAELAPFARTGGLGEAVAALAAAQAKAGLEVAVIVPFYRQIAAKRPRLAPFGSPLAVQVGGWRGEVQLRELVRPRTATEPAPRILFVDAPEFYDRDGLYGEGSDYADNHLRFAVLAASTLAALPRLARDGGAVLHAHDWHAALAPIYLRTWYRGIGGYDAVAAMLSVHNAGFQGWLPPSALGTLGLPPSLFHWSLLEWYGRVNLLKGGLAFADEVRTVSATHADELRTPDGGFGLHEAFRALGPRFGGITNGIDQATWDPATDRHIVANFDAADLSGKRKCKAALQRLFGLKVRSTLPLIAMTARLTTQKGLDLILGSGFLTLPAQFVFLGEGERRYADALAALAVQAPDRVGVRLTFTDVVEHKLLAGADICLMPSQYEPCGLTQMRAQRYGTLPLVRRVGGLADTVRDGVTGFLFDAYTSAAFVSAAARAITAWHDREAWAAMQRTAMARDFDWANAEVKYLDVYRTALARAHARS